MSPYFLPARVQVKLSLRIVFISCALEYEPEPGATADSDEGGRARLNLAIN
jgi:hypothetical protein